MTDLSAQEQGRKAYAERAWATAVELLSCGLGGAGGRLQRIVDASLAELRERLAERHAEQQTGFSREEAGTQVTPFRTHL